MSLFVIPFLNDIVASRLHKLTTLAAPYNPYNSFFKLVTAILYILDKGEEGLTVSNLDTDKPYSVDVN